VIERDYTLHRQKKKITDLEMGLTGLRERAVTEGINLDKRLFLLQSRHLIQQDTRYNEFRTTQRAGGMTNENLIFQAFLNKNKDEYKGLYGDDYSSLFSGHVAMASGGIVRGPTKALIGENGPEAVIPLRALGMRRGPGIRSGGSSTNMASSSGSGRNVSVHVITSDVIMDSTKVGRAITKIAISTPEA
jgi:hypothetical protein